MMDEKLIKEKMTFYTGSDIVIHIVKTDKEWLNCVVLKNKNGVYMINERKFGIMHLFLNEIYNISEKKEDKNVDTGETATKVD